MRAVDTALDVTSSGTPVHCSVPALAPVQQGNWVTVRQHSRRSKHTALLFRSEHQTGSPHSVTHPLRNLVKEVL